MSYVAYQNGNLWSVANSQTILCYLVDRSEAAALLIREGLEPSEILVSAPAEQWFPTLLSALEFTTSSVSEVVGQHVAKFGGDDLHERLDILHLLLARVTDDIATIAREIERQESEREQQAASEQQQAAEREQQAAREAELMPLRREYRQLGNELKLLDAWLEGQLSLLRRKSSFKRVKLSDLSGTKQYVRANDIRKRLAELEGALA
jgi:hypothetical protein